MWDLRAGKAVRCLKAFATPDEPNPAVTAVSFHPRSPYSVFVGAENALHRFDLRADRDQIVVRSSLAKWQHDDEINQIDVNAQGSYLAACDDSGDVRILDINKNGGQLLKTLSGKHTNVSCAWLLGAAPVVGWWWARGESPNLGHVI